MDREKVITEIEDALSGNLAKAGHVYRMSLNGLKDKALKDALELLKEHEAKTVMESTNMYTGLPITHCPKCGISLDRYLYGRQYEGQINYCPMCGQAVKWE